MSSLGTSVIANDPTYEATPDGETRALSMDTRGRLRTNVGAIVTQGYVSSVSLTRTADTSAYSAGDVIGIGTGAGNTTPGAAALTFAGLGPTAGGEVMISSSALEIDVNAVPSGMISFLLYLYSVTPPSALVDNNAWDLPAGDRSAFLGYIDLGRPVDLGSTLYIEANQIAKQVTVPAGGALYGYLVTNAAYTPSSAAVKKITLHSFAL